MIHKYIRNFKVFLLILACFIVLSCLDVDSNGNISILFNISISQEPNKTTYYVDERFDSAGLVVTAYYWDNTTKQVNDYTLSRPDMGTPGTKTVTVSYSLMSASFNITVIDVTPGVSIESITITQAPLKTTYYVNEEFDHDGLVVTAFYSDGSSKYISGYTLSKPDMSVTGTKTVTINYLGKTAVFDIKVIATPQGVSLNSIKISQPPLKTTYYVHEAFNSSGLVVTAYYSDGSSRHITGYSINTPDMSKTGTKTITATFEGKTANFNITVIPVPSGVYITSITVTQLPAKTTYNENETFNSSGLVVTANYSDGTSIQAIGYSLSTPNMGTAGTKTITVTYDGKTAVFNITVIAAPEPPVASLTSITITQTPSKTVYNLNETFNPAGLVITAAYNDGTSKQVSGFSLSTPDMSTAGTKTITVTFEGKTVTFSITVKSDEGGLDIIIY